MNNVDKKYREVKKKVYELIRDKDFMNYLKKQVYEVLNSGFIDLEEYSFEKNGYQIPKLIFYLALKRSTEEYKPLDTLFLKKYRRLIKNY